MKSHLSRFLVGGALLAACGQVSAAVMTIPANDALSVAQDLAWQRSSIEGNAAAALANGSAVVKIPQVLVALAGTGYNDGDVVTVTVGGATLRAASVGTALDVAAAANNADIACNDVGGNLGLKLRLTAVSANTITYVVRERNGAILAKDVLCQLGGAVGAGGGGNANKATLPFEVLASGLTAAGYITLNWSAATSTGTVHDQLRTAEGTPAATFRVHRASSEVANTANSSGLRFNYIKPDATSTVPARFQFVDLTTVNTGTGVGAAATNTTVAGQCLTSLTTTSTNRSATCQNVGLTGATTYVYTYSGNFGFIDNDSNGCSLADLTAGYGRITISNTGGVAVTTTVSNDCTTITTTGAARAESFQYLTVQGSLSATAGGGKALVEGTSTLSIAVRNGAGTQIATLTGGGITNLLNAATANIPYMPYGSGISRIVYITNRTATAGAVAISATSEAGTVCDSTNFPSVTAGASRVTLLSTAIDAGVATCFGAGWTGKVMLDLTVNVPPNSGDTVSLTTADTIAAGAGAITNGAITIAAGSATQANSSFDNSAAAVTPITNGAITIAAGSATQAASTLAIAAGSSTGTATGTVSRSASNIDVYSAYNVNGNRVQVINTTNGR